MKPLFQSPLLQKEFDDNGFVRVPFLSASQADELLRSYKTMEAEHEQIGIPFITTSHSNNHELIRKADEYIAAIFKPEMDRLLCNYEMLFGNFLIKQPGPDSITPPHQDTTFVDERNFSSLSVWVSLQDTDKQSGCMRFIKGSHRFRYILRPAHAYPWPFEGVKDKLQELMEDYPSKKGEAFIFHHGIIHASYPNLTKLPRVAALMAAYPAEAELLMLFLEKGNDSAVQKYKMTREAFLRFVKGEPPALGQLKETEHFDYRPVTTEELDKITSISRSLMRRFADGVSVFKKALA